MERTIKKFKNSLLEYRDSLTMQKLEKVGDIVVNHAVLGDYKSARLNFQNALDSLDLDIKRIDWLIEMVSIPEDELSEHTTIFYNFDELSKYLLKFHFSAKEQMDVIVYFIGMNIVMGMTRNEAINGFDAKKIKTHKFKHFTQSEVIELINTKEFKRLLMADKDELSEDDKIKREELEEFMKNNTLDLSEISKQHTDILEHWFEKLDSFNEEDIKIIIETLGKMKVAEEICSAIKYNLNKDLEKRQSTKSIAIKITTNRSEESKNQILSKKEYHQINNEISMYFDLENMKSIRYLSVSERIQIVTLLKQLNYKDEDIEKILSVIDNGNKKYRDTVDPVIEYADVMYKGAYYENQLGLEQYIQNVDEYIDEWLVADEDDCLFWQTAFKEEMDKVKGILPKTHEFELEEANKLLQLK